MILSDEYKDHIPRRIFTIRKMYLGNLFLLLLLIIVEFSRFSGIPGMIPVLIGKTIIGFAIIGFIFTGHKLPVGIHPAGLAMTFVLGFQVEVFTGEDFPFQFEEYTFKTGLILIGIIGFTGMNLFYSLLGSMYTLFVYVSTLYQKGAFSYSFFFLLIFLLFGIIVNGIINDQYEIEKEMIRLINYWKDYSSQLLTDKLPKEFHLQNATCLYIDITGIFSYFYESQSLKMLKSSLLHFYQEFEKDRKNFKIHHHDDSGHYWFVIYENPSNTDPEYADPLATFAIKTRDYFNELCRKNNVAFSLRMGIHSGKFTDYRFEEKNQLLKVFRPPSIFDRAKQMESEGVNGEIQTTHQTYLLLKRNFFLTRRDINSQSSEDSGVYILNRHKNHSEEIM